MPTIGTETGKGAEASSEIVDSESIDDSTKGVTGLIIYNIKKVGWPTALAMFAIIAVIGAALYKRHI